MEELTKAELQAVSSWGAAILKMAKLAEMVADVQDDTRLKQEVVRLEQAKQAADAMQGAADAAREEHKVLMGKLRQEAEAQHSTIIARLTDERARVTHEIDTLRGQVTEQKALLRATVEEHSKTLTTLRQERADLEQTVKALKAYAEQHKKAVGAL